MHYPSLVSKELSPASPGGRWDSQRLVSKASVAASGRCCCWFGGSVVGDGRLQRVSCTGGIGTKRLGVYYPPSDRAPVHKLSDRCDSTKQPRATHVPPEMRASSAAAALCISSMFIPCV